MNLFRAELKRRGTADGVAVLAEHIELGVAYYVDLDQIRPLLWHHPEAANSAVCICRCGLSLPAMAPGQDGCR